MHKTRDPTVTRGAESGFFHIKILRKEKKG